jgi:hypothetical protein
MAISHAVFVRENVSWLYQSGGKKAIGNAAVLLTGFGLSAHVAEPSRAP